MRVSNLHLLALNSSTYNAPMNEPKSQAPKSVLLDGGGGGMVPQRGGVAWLEGVLER